MKRIISGFGTFLVLVFPVTGWYFFDRVGCHVYESTGMCGWCSGGCWPYWEMTGACGTCEHCQVCKNGHQMDELCRCNDECPLGKYGANCDKNCAYRCRACNRTTGACLLWCIDLCLDGACHLSTGYCRFNMTKLLAAGCGAYNHSHCEEYSRHSIVG